jgi:enoyl-CoA hydratase/carnithine racemase
VAIYTGAGRAFCAGEDMKESVERGMAGGARPNVENPYDEGTLMKPVIAAINGYAMGGGFQLAERSDMRVAVRGAVFEMSEAKRWLLGGYNHGHIGGMSHAVATEMAFAFRFTAERLFELGWLNRLVEPEDLLPAAREMAEHLMTLPPASRVNTLVMMHAMRPAVSEELLQLADRLRDHGSKDDLMESRRAFAEKRQPNFRGWDDPEDRFRTPTLESIRAENAAERATQTRREG